MELASNPTPVNILSPHLKEVSAACRTLKKNSGHAWNIIYTVESYEPHVYHCVEKHVS